MMSDMVLKYIFYIILKKITVVVTTNSHCKSVIISGTIFYSWDYYNHIVKSTIIILYYTKRIFKGNSLEKYSNNCHTAR